MDSVGHIDKPQSFHSKSFRELFKKTVGGSQNLDLISLRSEVNSVFNLVCIKNQNKWKTENVRI